MHAYPLLPEHYRQFHDEGWVHLPAFLTEAELQPLEQLYMQFLRRELPVQGRDYCDMTGAYTRQPEEFAILNVMLPRRYHPPLEDNAYERRAALVAQQLIGDGIAIDYDQLVAKPPHKPDAVFHWHQDLGYWPKTPDPRTATFWLALDATDLDNGCLQFVDGSHREARLRGHAPLHGDRNQNHTMVALVDPRRDRIRPARLQRGDVTVHHERTLHGSGGNCSDRWRRGYVLAFRSLDTIARERAMGFTHSHNDPPELLARIAAEGRET